MSECAPCQVAMHTIQQPEPEPHLPGCLITTHTQHNQTNHEQAIRNLVARQLMGGVTARRLNKQVFGK